AMRNRSGKSHHIEYRTTADHSDVRVPVDTVQVSSLNDFLIKGRIVFTGFSSHDDHGFGCQSENLRMGRSVGRYLTDQIKMGISHPAIYHEKHLGYAFSAEHIC